MFDEFWHPSLSIWVGGGWMVTAIFAPPERPSFTNSLLKSRASKLDLRRKWPSPYIESVITHITNILQANSGYKMQPWNHFPKELWANQSISSASFIFLNTALSCWLLVFCTCSVLITNINKEEPIWSCIAEATQRHSGSSQIYKGDDSLLLLLLSGSYWKYTAVIGQLGNSFKTNCLEKPDFLCACTGSSHTPLFIEVTNENSFIGGLVKQDQEWKSGVASP